jgi:hypothetical protein
VVVRSKAGGVAVLLLTYAAGRGGKKRVGTRRPALHVGPEAHPDAPQVPLNFRASADDASGVTSQTTKIVLSGMWLLLFEIDRE